MLVSLGSAAASTSDNNNNKPYCPGNFFRQNLFDNGKMEKFIQLEKIAIEKMEQHQQQQENQKDPYSSLDSAIPYFGENDKNNTSVLLSLKPTDELLRWGISHSWAMTVQSNVETPLFDIMQSKMFS